jgi:hypothetical protein
MPVETHFSGGGRATKAPASIRKGLTTNSLQRKTEQLLKPQKIPNY